MRIRRLATSLVASLILFMPCATSAQQSSLARVDSLMKAGQFEHARSALEQWRKENETGAPAASQARATYLRARLASRADSAEDAYLTLTLSHPTSPYAAESLLRLGQARLAGGDAEQAGVYLQRLIADYPRSEYRALGALWLARTQLASNRAQTACTTIKGALQLQQLQSEAMALLRAEERVACAGSQVAARAVTVPANPPAAVPVMSARFAIQVGAFREGARARSLLRQIEKAGFREVRLAVVPENALVRVRVGQYETASAAQIAVARLKAAGFAGVVVADRQREKVIVD